MPVQQDHQLNVVVASTFTSEPIESVLRFWGREFGFETDICFAPYNQIMQQLLLQDSRIYTDETGLVLLFINPDDWVRNRQISDGEELRKTLLGSVSELSNTISRRIDHFKSNVIVTICKPSPGSVISDDLLSEVESELNNDFRGSQHISVITSKETDQSYPVDSFFDPQKDRLGHIPYTDDYFAALGTVAFRKYIAVGRKPKKVIVLDCDNTLWKGVCGEVGADGVQLTENFRYVQQFMADQTKAGMLLCLCSKNVEEDVQKVFDERADMVLREEHIVGKKINWEPKSQNIIALADELNLGTDSFIFIDDNPVECAEVKASCPEVLTLCLPENEDEIPAFLDHIWMLDHTGTTTEDQKRTRLYKDNLKRNEFRKQTASLKDFIESLDLNITFEEVAPDSIERVSQLTYRTNQFNFTTIRRTTEEIKDLLRFGGYTCITCTVSDRFGEYGLVGAMMGKLDDSKLVLDTFLLSCRVLGRGVEHKMVAYAGQVAYEAGLDSVEIHFRRTEKNKPAENFMAEVCKQFDVCADGFYSIAIHIDAHELKDFKATYREDIQDNSGAGKSIKNKTQKGAVSSVQDIYQTIALDYHSAERIASSFQTKTPEKPQAGQTSVSEKCTAAHVVLEIWKDILGKKDIGADDHFFDVGGTSLKAVEVLSRINSHFEKEFTIVSLFEHSTVNELTGMIEGNEKKDDELMAVLERSGRRGRNRRRV